MPDSSGWQEVRCRGCGRILFETARGMVKKRIHKRGGGDDELIVYGQPAVARCGACGKGWINPDMVAADGLGGVIERSIEAFRERVDVDLAADHDEPRSPLRPVA